MQFKVKFRNIASRKIFFLFFAAFINFIHKSKTISTDCQIKLWRRDQNLKEVGFDGKQTKKCCPLSDLHAFEQKEQNLNTKYEIAIQLV